MVFNLFADIAYRAAMLNPQLGDSVLDKTEGIVLIDEIELHLHPKWQQTVLADLAATFPRMQFVITTHAPSVIASANESQLVIVDGGDMQPSTRSFYGRDSDFILRELIAVPEHLSAVKELFSKFYDLADAGEYNSAEELLNKLKELLGNTDVELAACDARLDFERMDLS